MPSEVVRIRLAADPRAITGLLRDADMAALALRRVGHRLRADRRLLVPGTQVRVDAAVLPGVRIPLRTVVTEVSPGGVTSTLVSGPMREVEHVTTVALDGAGTAVHDELRWATPFGWAADPLRVRGLMRGVLHARADELARRVAELADLTVVVATAIVRDGRVLAAQRTRPAAVAGLWELPGGRVEPGESEPAAVVRECREELGADVVVAGRLGTDLPIDVGVLRVHRAALEPGSREPSALEHAALRWLGPADLETVEWVEADQAVMGDLRDLLTRRGSP